MNSVFFFLFLGDSHETTGDKLLQSYQRLRLENHLHFMTILQ